MHEDVGVGMQCQWFSWNEHDTTPMGAKMVLWHAILIIERNISDIVNCKIIVI